MTARTERPSDTDQWKDIARQLYVALSNRKCQCIKLPTYEANTVLADTVHQCMRCAAMARYEIEGALVPNSNG